MVPAPHKRVDLSFPENTNSPVYLFVCFSAISITIRPLHVNVYTQVRRHRCQLIGTVWPCSYTLL